MRRKRVIASIFGLAAALVLLGCGGTAKEAATSGGSAGQTSGGGTGQRPDNPYRIHQLKDLETVTFRIGENEFKAWIMDTTSKRSEGMMFLQDSEVRDDECMIFVFSEERPLSFWMRNTYIPLDIAFLDRQRRILNVETMKPLDETGVRSRGDAMYAIEFKKGTLSRVGARPGMKVEFPDTVKAKD